MENVSWKFYEIVKKIWRNVGHTSYKFFNILMEVLWHVRVNFSENIWKIIGKNTLRSLCLSRTQLSLCASWLRKIFPHFKSADVLMFIGMRRLESKAIRSQRKVNKLHNDYKNYQRPCNILVTLQNCKNLS